MKPFIAKLLVTLGTMAMFFCAVQQSAHALPTPPFVASAHVQYGSYWEGTPWPGGAEIGIKWTWDTSLIPAPVNFPELGAEWGSWQGPEYMQGLSILDIWGVPLSQSNIQSWDVQIYYGPPSGDVLFLNARLSSTLTYDLQLFLAPGTLEKGVLPSYLGMENFGNGAMFLMDATHDTDMFARVYDVHTTPEPSAFLLLGVGIIGIVFLQRRTGNATFAGGKNV